MREAGRRTYADRINQALEKKKEQRKHEENVNKQAQTNRQIKPNNSKLRKK